VIDNEAGMEHLSRRSTQPVDYLLIVSDVSKPGLKAAKRIFELSSELNIVTHKRALILNRADENMIEKSSHLVEMTGLDIIGWLPFDPLLEEFGFNDRSLMDIPEENPALCSVRDLLMKLDL
jgi:CO dehydrogenase maturation factor